MMVALAHPMGATAQGNAFGWSVVQRYMLEGLAAEGWDFGPSSVALHMTEPGHLWRRDDCCNVALTMWEHPDMDADRISRLRSMDLLLAPSDFCVEIFKAVAPDVPVRKCPLGIDVDAWPTISRDLVPPFRWLWVGAPNARKGWDVVEHVWGKVFGKMSGVELYMKTTGVEQGEQVVRRGNVTVDSRRLSDADLVGLYHSAHAFVFPTAGEGWGLTLQEAMATGLPSVVTRYGGSLEFTDAKSAFFVAHQLDMARRADGGQALGALADPNHVAAQMVAVMSDYRRARAVGMRGAIRARRFTRARSVGILSGNLRRALGRLAA